MPTTSRLGQTKKGRSLNALLNRWSRTEAEANISDVFEAAKRGPVQEVVNEDGRFEVRFIPDQPRERAGQYLARGGPDRE
jgi:hypothetical protein